MSEKFIPQEAADWSKEKLASQETLRTKDFAVVTQALGEGMANVYSGNDPALEEFLQQHNPDNQPYLLIADHSFGGRNFKLADNVSHVPYFHDEGLNGGWSLLRESDLQMVEMSSATSKTKVRAEKDDTGVWNLTLDVPQIEGQPYHGAYWNNFQGAAEMAKANVEDQAEITALKREANLDQLADHFEKKLHTNGGASHEWGHNRKGDTKFRRDQQVLNTFTK